MKIKTLLYTFFLTFIFFSFKVKGQTGTATAPVHYELIYNTTTCLYEAHAHVQSGILIFPFNIPFPSNFTIVIPESLPDVPIAATSYQPPSLSWTNSNNVYSPAADTIHDFHMFSISGGGAGQAYTTFQAGDDILLFTFSIPHSSCEEGIRIFINGMDPNSGAPGMGGLDLSNSLKTFDATGTFPQGIEQYEANINNSGIILPKPDPTPTFDCMGDTLILAANVDTSSYPSCLGPLTYSWSGQNNYSSTEENPVIIITDPEIQGGNYYVTVTDSNGCTSVDSIDVNALAIVTLSDPADECIDGVDLNFLASPAGGTFTTDAPAGFIPNNAAGTAVLDISVAGAGSYNVTYDYTNANGCSHSQTVSVTINPLPVVTLSDLNDVCIDASSFVLTGGMPIGGTYSGTGVSGGIFNPATAGVGGPYTITYTYTDANGCTNSATTDITVNPLPVVDAGTYGPFCIDDSAVTLTGIPTGGTFSGTGVSGTTFTPLTAGSGTHTITYEYTDANGCTNSGTTDIIVNLLPIVDAGTYGPNCLDDSAVTLTGSPSGGTFSGTGVSGTTFTPASAGSGTHTITYTYTDANGCINSATTDIVVNPLPLITLNDPADECIDGADMNFTATPVGGTFSTTAIAGFTANNAAGTAILDISAAGAGTYDVSYSYTDANGCMNDSIVSVTINLLPVVDAGAYGPYCVDDSAITLVGSPTGGTFSGNGVNANMFDPTIAGEGLHTITYEYFDANGCSNSGTTEIVVNGLPIVDAGTFGDLCHDSDPIALDGIPVGGIFSGTGVSGNLFDPEVSGTGDFIILYEYIDTNGCYNSDTTTIKVNPLPIVESGNYGPYCIDVSSVMLSGNPTGGIFSGPGISGNTFEPVSAGVGSHEIIYTYVDPITNCEDTSSTIIVVNDLPILDAGSYPDLCVNDDPISLVGTPPGGSFSGSGVMGNMFDPSFGQGNYTITYEYEDENGCYNSNVTNITVNPLPLVNAGTYGPFCVDASPITLAGSPTGGTFSGTGVSGNMFDPTTAGEGTHTITYEYMDANGCTNSSTTDIVINLLPLITLNDPADECIDGMDMNFTATPIGGTFSTTATTGFTANNAAGTAVLDVSLAGIGTYDVSYSYTDANGCTNDSIVSVTVNPLPIITLNDPADECIDGADMNFTATPAGGTFSTTATAGFTTNNAAGTAVLFVSAAGAGTYDVSYSYTDANGCTSDSIVSVTVNALPTITLNDPVNECIDGADMNFTATPAGGTFSTTATAGFTTNNAAGTAVLDVSLAGAGTYDVSYSYTDANGCNNDSIVSVTVNPTPIVDAGTYGPLCIDASAITLTGSPTGGTFSGPGVSGGSFDPATAGAGTHTITYEYTDANGCTNSATTDIVVNPLPVVDAGTNYGPLCVDASAITLTGSPTGGTFSGPGVSGGSFDPATAGSGTHTITYEYTDANGCTNSATTDIIVNPLPVVDAGNYGPLCVDASAITLTGSPTGGTFSGPGVSGGSFDPATAGSGTHTITYEYTDANGCTNSATTDIVVNPLPVVDAGTYGPLCVDASSITLTGSPTGGTFSGPGVSGGSFDPATAGAGTHTITYEYTDANGCTNSATTDIVVNPLPVVDAGNYGPLCVDASAITLTGSPTGGTFSGPGVSGGSFDPATAGSGTHTITYEYTDANGCTNSATTDIVVNPLPVVDAGTNYGALCVDASAITLTGSPTGGTFSGPGVSGGSFDPATAGSGTHTITYEYTDANGCTNSATTDIVVNPLPVVDAGNYGPLCVDASSITLTGSPTGGTFSGPGVSGGSFDPATAGAGTHTITYEYTDANGCTNSATTDIVVNPLPVVDAGTYEPLCVDASAITLTGSPTGGTFSGPGVSGGSFDPAMAGSGTHTITYEYTDANGCTNSATTDIVVNPLPVVDAGNYGPLCVDASAITLTGSPTGGTFSGPGVSGRSFDPATAGSGTHTITYEYTDANGCTNSATTDIVVNPLPVVDAGTYEPLCVDASAITLTGSPTGGTFSGLGVSGGSFDPATAGAGTHTITYEYTDANGCTNSATTDIVVNPLPVVDAGTYESLCIDASAITLTGSPTGGTFSGPGVSGGSFDPATAGSGTHTITYEYTDANGCTNSATTDIVVNPLPVVDAGTYEPLCVDASAITLTGSPTGGTFSGPGVNGGSFDPATAGSGTHTITYEYTDTNGCTNSATTDIVVNPLPVVDAGTYGALCVDASAITLTGSPTGGTFSGPGVSGGSFDPATAGSGTHTITYEYTDANGCTNSATTDIVVNPLPVVDAGTNYGALCVDASAITLTGSPTGGTFSGPGVSGGSFDPATAGSGTHTITYEYTDANGCTNSATTDIVVNPLPVVDAGNYGPLCVDASAITLTGSPTGGTFSGPGVSGGSFDPATAGAGTHTITYEYTDANGCTNSATTDIVVNPLPVVDAGTYGALCVDASAITLTGSPTGGTISGPGVSGGSFDPAMAGSGTHTITYEYTDANGCTNSATTDIVVNPLPVVDAGNYGPLCVDASAITLTGSPTGGTFSGPGVSGGSFDPATAGSGTHTITYEYTDANGCTNSATTDIVVNPLPVVDAGTNYGPLCVDASAITLTGSPTGGTFSGLGVSGGSFDPATAGAGTHTITYEYTDANGCTNSATTDIVVNPLPVVDAGTYESLCIDASAITLTGSPTGGTFSGPGVSGGSFDPATAGSGTHTITYEYTDANGCTNSATTDIVVNPLPVVDAGTYEPLCVDASAITLTGSPTGGTYSGPGVNGGSFDPATAGSGTHTITYEYTDANGCTNSATTDIVVNPLPVVDAGTYGALCVDASAITLTGSPTGGTFSGLGVSGGSFDPATAGSGTHTITYEYTDANGCTNSATTDIVVNPLPVVDAGTYGPLCVDASSITLTGSPTGGTFSGPGVSGGSFDPATSGSGTHTITYEYTDANGCTNSATTDIVVNPLPVVDAGTYGALCVDASAITLTGSPTGGTFSGPGVSGGSFDPSIGAGNYTILYEYVDGNGCINNANTTIDVNDLPIVTLNHDQIGLCQSGQNINLVGSPLPDGINSFGTFQTTIPASLNDLGDGNAIFNVAGVEPGFYDVTYNYIDINGCSASFTISIEVCSFDLALTKKVGVPTDDPIEQGSTVTFDIIVTNEGTLDATNVQVGDNIPAGLELNDGNWVENNGVATLITPIPSILSGESDTVSITFSIAIDYMEDQITNVAEVISSKDTEGNNQDDEDSIPNNADGSPYEDDEDEETIEVVQIFDLALIKILGEPTDNPIRPGSTVTFDLVVFNQGTLDAYTVQINDYIPTGLILVDSNWDKTGQVATLVNEIPFIAAGTSDTVSITFTVDPDFSSTEIINNAEINSAYNVLGVLAQDVDSEPGDNENSTPDPNDDNIDDTNGGDDFDPSMITVILNVNIGGFVWADTNGNGIQESGELGIADVLILLYDEDNNLVGVTDTDINGNYEFVDLFPNTYYMVFADPEGYTLSDPNQGIDDELDSDVTNFVFTEEGSTTDLFTLVPGQDDDYSIDAGYYICVPIGESVWYDVDKDDIFDSNENGINGLVVNLYKLVNGSYVLYDATITVHKPGTPSDDGYFKFCSPPGTYYIEVVMPPIGLVQTIPNIFNNLPIENSSESTKDSDLTNNFGQGTTAEFSVESGDQICNIGAGFYPMATIGNLVWLDENLNGLQEENEQKVSGVLVEAFNTNGEKISESTTNNAGVYNIDYLQKQDYYLKFSPPEGYGFIEPDAGDDDIDSDVNHSNGYNTTDFISMQPGLELKSVDAGIQYGALPVVWLSIAAEWKGDFNEVRWTTASETNNDFYEVERRHESESEFVYIGQVDAKGLSSSIQNYNYRDFEIERTGKYYYRIKQVDLDGKFNYSEIVFTTIKNESNIVDLYPNPSIGYSKLVIDLSSNSEVEIKIINAEGKVIKSIQVPESNGERMFREIEVADLPLGVYMIHIAQNDFKAVKKLIVVK